MYDFRIILKKIELKDNLIIEPFCAHISETTVSGTLSDATAKMIEVSELSTAPSKCYIQMKYRDDKKPRGFNKVAPIFKWGEK